jgi:GTPase KRas protein
MLVGNKSDMTSEREVLKEEGSTLAQQFGCEYIEVSAKTAHNVEHLFIHLIRSLRQTKHMEPGPSVQAEEDARSQAAAW